MERTKAAVLEALETGGLDRFRDIVDALASTSDPAKVAAAAVKLIFRAHGGERSEQEIPVMPVRPPESHRPMQRHTGYADDDRHRAANHRSPQQVRRHSVPGGRETGMTRVYIGAGREAGIRPGDLVGAIANEAKVDAKVIGAIAIEERFSIVDVPSTIARDIIETLSRARLKGRKVAVRPFRERNRLQQERQTPSPFLGGCY
jgi:ATP-dependent RNA helicase DeaD